ncbi:MAG: chromate transporter [Bdellovibrionales bacterium]|nr:chromate transporter [Bdellovibrionales bacterium]
MLTAQIFWVFFKISLLSFGGVFAVLSELERMVVNEHGWLTHERFIQSYVVSQFVPGPNMAMCPLIGYWVGGWTGWVAGFVGIYSGPVLVMSAAYVLFSRYKTLAWVSHTEHGLRALILGLFIATAGALWWSQSAGVSAAALGHPQYTHLLALALSAASLWVYQKKWVSPMNLILIFGAAWWGLNRVLF